MKATSRNPLILLSGMAVVYTVNLLWMNNGITSTTKGPSDLVMENKIAAHASLRMHPEHYEEQRKLALVDNHLDVVEEYKSKVNQMENQMQEYFQQRIQELESQVKDLHNDEKNKDILKKSERNLQKEASISKGSLQQKNKQLEEELRDLIHKQRQNEKNLQEKIKELEKQVKSLHNDNNNLKQSLQQRENRNNAQDDKRNKNEQHLQQKIQQLEEKVKAQQIKSQEQQKQEQPQSASTQMFPDQTNKFAYAMSRVNKTQILQTIGFGVPEDVGTKGDSEAIVLYKSSKTVPNSLNDMGAGADSATTIPLMKNADEAFENCDYVNVMLTSHDPSRRECLAIIPQYESYHLYKYARVLSDDGKGIMKLDSKVKNFTLVGSGYLPDRLNAHRAPNKNNIHRNWNLLRKYLNVVEDVTKKLKPKLKKIHKDNTIIVMVVNYGQSEVLLNFICSAKARGFDLSNVLVFTTDEETKQLVDSFGLSTFYDERIFGDISSDEARDYGDANFISNMMAKVMTVQLVNFLEYDVLFQDVDVVWHHNPLDWFHNKLPKFDNFDMFFQDDGSRSTRFAPLSANSGFYYVRYNDRTQYLMSSLMLSTDMIIRAASHQQAMIALMNEHMSLYGLRVKVFSRETEEFPAGYHFHHNKGEYMRSYFSGEKDPIIIHMSWTLNKDSKIQFLQQMGEWYLNDKCTHHTASEIITANKDYDKENLDKNCCTAEPVFSCHYKDKASIKPCYNSPSLDKNQPSFWKPNNKLY